MKTKPMNTDPIIHVHLKVDGFIDSVEVGVLPRSPKDSDDFIQFQLSIERLYGPAHLEVHPTFLDSKDTPLPCSKKQLEKCLKKKMDASIGRVFSNISEALVETLMDSLRREKALYFSCVQNKIPEFHPDKPSTEGIK